ncbi:hypothetical protein I3843_02G045500 [Carya illinoinensis]|nr:hypothetical protein I3843_02G045500 [Carya illinoinensis]
MLGNVGKLRSWFRFSPSSEVEHTTGYCRGLKTSSESRRRGQNRLLRSPSVTTARSEGLSYALWSIDSNGKRKRRPNFFAAI